MSRRPGNLTVPLLQNYCSPKLRTSATAQVRYLRVRRLHLSQPCVHDGTHGANSEAFHRQVDTTSPGLPSARERETAAASTARALLSGTHWGCRRERAPRLWIRGRPDHPRGGRGSKGSFKGKELTFFFIFTLFSIPTH
jgi:hypothetical protein